MTETTTSRPAPRLKQVYREEIIGKLQEEFEYANPMQVPGLTKVVVNMGVGDAARDSKLIEGAINDLTLITGQKPVVTRARKSVAQFKLRSEEHTSELQSRGHLVCRLLLEKKKTKN